MFCKKLSFWSIKFRYMLYKRRISATNKLGERLTLSIAMLRFIIPKVVKGYHPKSGKRIMLRLNMTSLEVLIEQFKLAEHYIRNPSTRIDSSGFGVASDVEKSLDAILTTRHNYPMDLEATLVELISSVSGCVSAMTTMLENNSGRRIYFENLLLLHISQDVLTLTDVLTTMVGKTHVGSSQ